MFTGIIEETGRILAFSEAAQAYRLVVSADAALQDLAMGDSIAVNGCCLTVVAFDADSLSFDLLAESVRLTGFRRAKPGDRVNLERALRFNGKIGGHFVTGHVDGTGIVTVAERRGKDLYLRIQPGEQLRRYLFYKGSIALDGVSLTVAEADADGFAVWLIPHTLERTNLLDRKPGDAVNLEADLLAKTIEQLLPGQREIQRSVG